MPDNKLYTLQQLIEEGVNSNSITQIVIPKIQRAYAQGREEEIEVRTSILNNIFEALESEKNTEFSFIYGSLCAKGDETDFELLDGQQRITTLYLIHLYIYLREEQQLPEWMKNCFTYQTRTSSSDFISKVQELTGIIDSNKCPSQYIKKKLWFSNAFNVDSTVQAMLTMLDAIHNKYNASGKELANNLHVLQFYVLPLDKFGLTEDLYIKMNARGLSLTPFENFKADLVGYYKPNEETASDEALKDWLEFATKLDTTWIDLFWNKEDKDDKSFNDKFFRFFYRYCTIATILQLRGLNNYSKLFSFFDGDSEQQSQVKIRYLGFDPYLILLENKIDLKADATKILDTLIEYKSDIFNQLTSQWGETFFLFGEKNSSYTREAAIAFAAITQFILNYDSFNVDNYKKWMRVVWNVIENTLINTVDAQVNTTRNLCAILVEDKQVGDIYLTLKTKFLNDQEPQAIIEEAHKAKLIIEDKAYEDVLKTLEKLPFFQGFADVVVSENVAIDILKRRIERIQLLFDKDGISLDFRKKHLLIRAMIASINKWNGGLHKLSITEKVNPVAHLKGLLRKKQIKNMLQSVLDGTDDMYEALQTVIDNRYIDPAHNNGLNDNRVKLAYDRLCTDAKLHNWIAAHCNVKSVVVKEYAGFIKVRVPGAWYDKIYIDNKFKKYIQPLLNELEFDFCNESNENDFAKYGYVPGDDIFLEQKIGDFTLQVAFNYYGQVRFILANIRRKYKEVIASNWPDANFEEKTNVEITHCTYTEAEAMATKVIAKIKELS